MDNNTRKRAAGAVGGGWHAPAAAGTGSTQQQQHQQHEEEDEDGDEGLHVSDAEATVLLLRQKLFPDPATAAAAAQSAKQSRQSKHSKTAAGPSKATAAAITAAAAAAAAAKSLPPILTKSQLYTVLTDRTAADRDLEGLRQKGRVRVFKLAIGADEYVLLLAQDYITLIDTLIHKHQQLAAQPAQQQQAAAAAGSNADNAQHHDPSTSSPAESASIAATIKLFRDRVVPAWHDATIPRSTLLQLLQSTPTPPLPTAPTAPADRAQQQQKSSCRQPQPGARAGGAVPVRSSSSQPPYERHLMAVDLMTRDSRSPDSYLLTVPGAAVFVKSVLSGRQEVLQLLARKKFNEVLEKELVCMKLRNSCLTPSYIMKDLQGRGLITLTDTTAGPLIRLAQRK